MTPIIDMHCDTVYKIYELRRQGQDVELRSNNLHLKVRCLTLLNFYKRIGLH